uniref:uncharacterized protein LOC120340116 n=1 Tax=Styela clava TaxID=7725 RepID=UPI00193A3E10|nr:uncharacterized protein LOC120340116 [Styela clava]
MSLKFIATILFCLLFSSAFSFPSKKHEQELVEFQENQLSEEGRIIMRKIGLRMLAELCLVDEPEPTIYQTICIPALENERKAKKGIVARSCMCAVADPVCFAACPV